MTSARTAHARTTLFRAVSGFLLAILAAGALGGCIDLDESSATSTTTTKPTAKPKPTPKPSAATKPTSKPASAAVGSGNNTWTVLVYLDGDNNLEPEAIGDFNEMASVGSTDALNIIVQFDRVKSDEDWDDTTSGDWGGVKRFRVERRKRPVAGNQLANLGELNMGNPKTLSDFATWGIQTYPADHYALIFWDHGASWPGIASDDTSDGDMLTLSEVSSALATVQKNTGVEKLDLIGFDACLMGQIDVLETVAPYGHVAIGSADLEPGEGWAWNAWLADVAEAAPDDAAALAPSIIDSFTAFYKKEEDPSVTLAAFDLDKVEQMTTQLDTLSAELISAMPDSFKAIGEARAHAAEYASGDTDISAIDLGYFASSLASAKINTDITKAARELNKTIKAARIAQGYGADHPKSTGISVYFPWKKKHFDASYKQASPLTKVTQWDEFLQAFYGAGKRSSTRATISKPVVNTTTVSADAPLDLSATISGDDTAYVYYFVGAVDPTNTDALHVWSMDYLYPPGTSLNDAVPSWSDGDPVQMSWKATNWYLDNGTDVVRVPLAPIDYGSSTYSVDGTYTAKKTGKQTPVTIEFGVTQGRGELEHVWAFDKANSDNPRPRELTPRAGDTFTPDVPVYTSQSEDVEDQTVAGDPITFGDTPLAAFEAEAPSGEFVIGLLVENVAGDISDQYANVTVDNPNGTALPAIPAAAPAPASGASAGTLRFHDEQLGVQIDYPDTWHPSSPGTDKAVFTDETTANSALAGIDAYLLEGEPADANRAMLQDILDTAAKDEGFALKGDIAATRVAGRDALRTEYVYQDQDGAQFHVASIAVSDPATQSIFLLTFDAPEATFATDIATFEQMLASFSID